MSEKIEFACPYCEKVSRVPGTFAGKRGKCPHCKKVIEVPDPNAEDDDEPEERPRKRAPARKRRRSSREDDDDDHDRRPSRGGGGGGVTRDCPYCGEEIKKVAKKCKFCGEFLDKRLGGRGRRGGARGPAPESNLVWAILATLFCCWPAGIVAIIYAVQVNSKWSSGDAHGARAAANNAKTWATVSTVGGLLVGVLYAFAIAAGG